MQSTRYAFSVVGVIFALIGTTQAHAQEWKWVQVGAKWIEPVAPSYSEMLGCTKTAELLRIGDENKTGWHMFYNSGLDGIQKTESGFLRGIDRTGEYVELDPAIYDCRLWRKVPKDQE